MNTTIKSILNATWKVGIGLFGIAALIVGILIFDVWYDNGYGRNYSGDKNLSKDIAVHSYNGNRARVWNRRTGSYVTSKLRWVSGTPSRDSLTVYCDVDGNRGYINCNTGAIVIPAGEARYRHAWQFSEGSAFVVLPDEEDVSVIDSEGKIIARNVAPYNSWYDYLFENGVCQIRVDDRVGLLAKDGTWAVEPKYYEIECPNTFGYRIARNEWGYWLYTPDLKLAFPDPYDRLSYAIGRDEGDGTLFRTRNHVKQLVNYDGSVVEPFVIDGTYNLKYMIRYNVDREDEYALDPDLVVYQVDNWEGLMNKHTGKIVTPATYTDFNMISKDLIKAQLGLGFDDEAVVLDRNGRIVKQ